MKKLIIIIGILAVIGCKKDDMPILNCESCKFAVQLVRSNGDTLTDYFEYKDIRWVYGIPDDVGDVCLYFDTTKSAKVNQFYIGRICE